MEARRRLSARHDSMHCPKRHLKNPCGKRFEPAPPREERPIIGPSLAQTSVEIQLPGDPELALRNSSAHNSLPLRSGSASGRNSCREGLDTSAIQRLQVAVWSAFSPTQEGCEDGSTGSGRPRWYARAVAGCLSPCGPRAQGKTVEESKRPTALWRALSRLSPDHDPPTTPYAPTRTVPRDGVS